jgi:cytochrome P450
MRFALVEAKAGLAKLLSNFEFVLDTEKSPRMNISVKKLILSNDGGIFMKVKKL